MAPIIVDISEAVAGLLAAASLSQAFAIKRAWVEVASRDRMAAGDPILVTILPGVLVMTAFDMKPRIAATWEVIVSITRAVQLTTASIDPIAGFVEEVAFLLAGKRLVGTPEGRVAQCVGLEARPVHDPEQLAELKLYRAIVAVTYRVTQ